MDQGSNILVFNKSKDTGYVLRTALESILPIKSTEFYHSIEDLSERLLSSGKPDTVLLLFVHGRKDLTDLFSIRNLINGTRTIIVLPDKHDDTVALANSLKPRFLGYRNGNFHDWAAVLGNMVGKPLKTGREGRLPDGHRQLLSMDAVYPSHEAF